jgi:hypothetical protein
MNIHEYQAKELLQQFGAATPGGKVAARADEAERIAREVWKAGSRSGLFFDVRRFSGFTFLVLGRYLATFLI